MNQHSPPELDSPGQLQPDPGPADLPGWAPVTEPPGPGNPDPTPASELAGVDLGGGYAIEGPRPSTPASTRSTAPGRIVAGVTARGIGDAMTNVFRGLGEGLNSVTAVDEQDDVWLATDEEAKAIGQPVGRIIARRVPDLPAGDASDLGDGIAAAIPFALYLVRNLATWVPRIRRKRKTDPAQVKAPDLSAAAVTA